MGKIKSRIKKYLIGSRKKGGWIGRFGYRLIDRRRDRRYDRFADLPVDSSLIVFESFRGRKYADSPRAIYEFMLNDEHCSGYRFAWCFRDSVMDEYRYVGDEPRTTLVRWGSEDYNRIYATAAYWFANTRLPKALKKREGQVYTQTWHGTPLKKLGCDITTGATESAEETREAILSDVIRYDHLISPSRYCSEKLSSAFDLAAAGKQHVIMETGYPRNDSLADRRPERIDEIKKRAGIPAGKKVILYAPTYREDMMTGPGAYAYREPLDLAKLREDLGDGYVMLFRTHYFIREGADADDHGGFIIDVTGWPDINELYLASDMLLTDYSSVFFDYGILGRPVVFYMYDLERYRDSLRGLYLGLDELPGPVAVTQDELTRLILASDEWSREDEWVRRYSQFSSRFTYLEDGHAAERAVRAIIG